MRSNEEFADVCRDYAQIVGDIARNERTPGHSSELLGELLRLRADLESDIVEILSETGENSTALDYRDGTYLEIEEIETCSDSQFIDVDS